MLLLARLLESLGHRHLPIVVAFSQALVGNVLIDVSARHSSIITVVKEVTVAGWTLCDVKIVVLGSE